MYLIHFEGMVSGNIFLYSFTICSLSMYRMATDLCKLIWYLATMLRLFMVSRSFLDLLGERSYQVCVGIVWLLYLFCIPFTSFSCVIALANISKTTLNRSRERDHSCLVPDFRRNSYSFSPLSMMFFYMLIIYILYYVQVHSFYS
jgi:hypothetical protein